MMQSGIARYRKCATVYIVFVSSLGALGATGGFRVLRRFGATALEACNEFFGDRARNVLDHLNQLIRIAFEQEIL
jgi:hypothetical protein